MPAVLALLSSVLWGGADFLGGTASRRLPALVVVAASQLAGLLAIAVVAVALRDLDAAPGYVPWAVAAGLSGLGGLVAFYAALAMGTMGVVSPIAAIGVVVPVVVGLATGDRPGPWQLLGMGLAVVGVVLASGPELSGRAGARPLILAAVAAVGFGCALLFIAKGSETSTVMTLTVMRMTSVTVVGVVLLVLFRRTGSVVVPGVRDVPLLAVIGLGDVAANLTFAVASTGDDVSIVAVLGSLYPVATVLLARIVHDERMAGVQTVGVSAALTGVVLIAAG